MVNYMLLHLNPIVNARMLDDRRMSKMIIEAMQMMVTAQLRHDPDSPFIPFNEKGERMKPTHQHHPVTKWVGDSQQAYWHIGEYAQALCFEYEQRNGKIHSCRKKIELLRLGTSVIPLGEWYGFVQAMPEEYKNEDPVIAYRDYFNAEKLNDKNGKRYAFWRKGRGCPDWWIHGN